RRTFILLSFSFYCFPAPRDLHSFPTRRSSDLLAVAAYTHFTELPVIDICAAIVYDGRDIERLGGDRGGEEAGEEAAAPVDADEADRKSTRLNSSHVSISYAVFCLKKKTKNKNN